MPSLGNDLASIRKELDISIEDIHQTTKVPVHILQSIEDDSIFASRKENNTYIRSYIRSYAKALGIDEREIIKALNLQEKGRYNGFLAGDDNEVHKPKVQPDVPEEPPQPDEETGDMVHDHVPSGTTPGEEDVPEEQHQETSSHSQPPQSVQHPPVSSVDWANMGRKFTPHRNKSRLWIGIVFVSIVIIAALGFFAYKYTAKTDQPTATENPRNATPKTVPADSLQLNLDNSTPATDTGGQATLNTQSSITGTLPDTLELVIYAAYDKLEPVRVYTDVMNSLNPYWIEKGAAFEFPFVNIIRIRGQYNRMVLLLNGHVIKNFQERFYRPETGMVVLERSVFENDPKWLQPPPDSLDINAPAPVIKQRPTFN